jgi:hypothetical protein
MVYVPKVGDYVSWKEGEEVRYGLITAAKSGALSVKPYNPKKTEADGTKTASASEYKNLQTSSWARMKFSAKPNMIEVAENSAFASAYHTIIAKNRLFGPENLSFMLADSLHEFLTKGLAIKMADMFKPYELSKDSNDLFQTADIWDSAQKLPFVTGFQAVIQKFVFKRPLNHQLMSNIFGNAGIFYLSNVADRMFYADDNKTPSYRYK